jgi:hypothetical protein
MLAISMKAWGETHKLLLRSPEDFSMSIRLFVILAILSLFILASLTVLADTVFQSRIYSRLVRVLPIQTIKSLVLTTGLLVSLPIIVPINQLATTFSVVFKPLLQLFQ